MRSKRMLRSAKILVVGFIVLGLMIDTASACRILRRRWCQRCSCVPRCCQITDIVYSADPPQRTAPEPQVPVRAVPEEPVPMAPAPEEPAPEQPEPEAPAPEAPGTEQPESGLDDLFGTLPEEPAQEESAPEAPAPEAPGTEQPESGLDDLFGTLPEEPQVEEPAPEAPAPGESEGLPGDDDLDDLFGSSPAIDLSDESAPAEPAEPAELSSGESNIDDLFGTPPAAESPAEDTNDDLFDPLNDDPVPSEAAPEVDPLEDIFGDIRSNREWIDNTGLYRTRGRLIAVEAGQIRLLKENGHTCTLSLRRLSQADRDFVQPFIAQMDVDTAGQLSAR